MWEPSDPIRQGIICSQFKKEKKCVYCLEIHEQLKIKVDYAL